MSLLSKIGNRTVGKATSRIADNVSDKIVDSIFGKKKEPSYEDKNITIGGPSVSIDPAVSNHMMSGMEDMMNVAHNTKRCPNCSSLCFSNPIRCKYCDADLTGVSPLTPEELEKLNR